MTPSAHPDGAMIPLPAEPAKPVAGVVASTPPSEAAIASPDIERLATNAARFIEQSGKALAAYLKPYETGAQPKSESSEIVQVALTSIGKVAEHWMADPGRLAEAQASIATPFLQLWAQTYRRMTGEVAAPVVPVAKGDKRYSAADWADLPLYDFLRQAHTIGATWAEGLVDRTTEIDPRTRAKAKFYLRQISSATSPANFLATNPELMRQTFATSGENLVRGAAHLAEDMEAGRGPIAHPPDRSDPVRARRQRRDDARQGDLPQRSDRVDPVCADDRQRAQAAVARHSALDQQVLHPRPQRGEELRPMGARSRGHALHDLMGESRSPASRKDVRNPTCARASSQRSTA